MKWIHICIQGKAGRNHPSFLAFLLFFNISTSCAAVNGLPGFDICLRNTAAENHTPCSRENRPYPVFIEDQHHGRTWDLQPIRQGLILMFIFLVQKDDKGPPCYLGSGHSTVFGKRQKKICQAPFGEAAGCLPLCGRYSPLWYDK